MIMAAAVLSAESLCFSQSEVMSCVNGVAPGSSSCSAVDKFVSCMESKLSACDKSFKDTTMQQFKTIMTSSSPALANCNSSPKPSPSPSPKPISSPSPAEEASSASCASLDLKQKMTECQAPLMQAAAGGNV